MTAWAVIRTTSYPGSEREPDSDVFLFADEDAALDWVRNVDLPDDSVSYYAMPTKTVEEA